MTIAAEQVINGVTQERNLVTELPGPRSRGLLARKEDAVSSGVGLGPPVFVTKAGGGILVDADGNSLIDMGSINATISQSE
jgi:4-aminobutyrate aminotransferase/(S)-3-amino-2-methylpropionate transaminase